MVVTLFPLTSFARFILTTLAYNRGKLSYVKWGKLLN